MFANLYKKAFLSSVKKTNRVDVTSSASISFRLTELHKSTKCVCVSADVISNLLFVHFLPEGESIGESFSVGNEQNRTVSR